MATRAAWDLSKGQLSWPPADAIEFQFSFYDDSGHDGKCSLRHGPSGLPRGAGNWCKRTAATNGGSPDPRDAASKTRRLREGEVVKKLVSPVNCDLARRIHGTGSGGPGLAERAIAVDLEPDDLPAGSVVGVQDCALCVAAMPSKNVLLLLENENGVPEIVVSMPLSMR